ncbi:MAG: hypothetical protein IJA94_03415 [Bacilli bacterium]|nr:hypothetical protein [Bacilli bacterium]
MDDLAERLRQLKNEDFIWLIYIGIIVLSWIANSLERKYFIFNDLNSKEKYRNLMIFIFVILIIIYLYFLNDSFNDVKKLKPFDPENKKNLTFLSFIGSLFVTISGFIFLYIIIKDEQIDVEIAFN